MKDLKFEYERLTTLHFNRTRTYERVSITYKGIKYAEDCRVYWFGMVWGRFAAHLKLLKRAGI